MDISFFLHLYRPKLIKLELYQSLKFFLHLSSKNNFLIL